MKYLSMLMLIFLLLLTFPGCNKSGADNNQPIQSGTETSTSTKDTDAKKIIDANARQAVVVVTNPNKMDLETKAIAASEIAAEKKMVEELGEMIIESVAKDGIEVAKAEINKSRNGAFKAKIFPEKYFYLSFLEKIDGVWTIIAHGTNPDLAGVQLALDQWADKSGWLYLNETVKKSAESNFVYTENVYWSDDLWAGGKISRFDAYSRFFEVAGKSYWTYFSIWKDK